MRTWKEPKPGTGRIRVGRDTWRTTICRLIRAEQEVERATNLMNAAFAAGNVILKDNDKLREGIPAAKQAGRDEVLKLIARWGKCRPLEGMGGADMAEALRKVLTPTIAPYTDYKGMGQAVADGEVAYSDFQPGVSDADGDYNPASAIEDYDWRPAGNGLEERRVTRHTMQYRSTPK